MLNKLANWREILFVNKTDWRPIYKLDLVINRSFATNVPQEAGTDPKSIT